LARVGLGGLTLAGLVSCTDQFDASPRESAPSTAPVPATTGVPASVFVPGVVTTSAGTSTLPETELGQDPLALEVLALIPVEREQRDGYVREDWRYGLDADGDGCDTRAEVLIAESLNPAQVDVFGCGVVEGDWWSAYDAVATTNPGDLQVDHVVALKEAHDSGGRAWTPGRKAAFANDLTDARTLIAVTAESNQDKSDKDPSNWLPPVREDWCRYLGDWVVIKARWGLSMDPSEAGRVRNVLTAECPELRVEPWLPPPPDLTGA
jgi:hypothetical protein